MNTFPTPAEDTLRRRLSEVGDFVVLKTATVIKATGLGLVSAGNALRAHRVKTGTPFDESTLPTPNEWADWASEHLGEDYAAVMQENAPAVR